MRKLHDDIINNPIIAKNRKEIKKLEEKADKLDSANQKLALTLVREWFEGIIQNEEKFEYGDGVYSRAELIDILTENADYAWDRHAISIRYLGDGLFETYAPHSDKTEFQFRVSPITEKVAEE